MLTELFTNRMILYANGPKGSCRKAIKGADRWKYYHNLYVAFKLAVIVGLIKDKYFSADGRSLKLKIDENMVKIRKVAIALDELVRAGVISNVRNGKIFLPQGQEAVPRRETMQKIIDRLKEVKGYGPLDEKLAWKNIETKDAWEMLVPAGKRGYWQGASHFLNTWGVYSLLIDMASKDAACAKVLCDHKKLEAERIGPACPIFQPERLLKKAEREARDRDIEMIKRDLQADNREGILLLCDEDGVIPPPLDFVISDVHLREYHHENTDDILRFIWMVKRLNGRLILAGDTFDVWRAGGLEKCWGNNTRIVNALTKLREVVLVAGNHDEFLVSFARRGGIFANSNLKVVENYVSADKRIRIFHGHQFDIFNRPGSWIGRLVTRAVTRMEMSWVKSCLDFIINRVAPAALNSFAGFFGFIFGPRLSERLLLLPKLFLPARYTLDRQIKNIIEWLDSEVEIAGGVDLLELSDEKPLCFVIGHIHFAGISFMIEKLAEAVKEKYGEKVKLIVTDSWTNCGGFIGDYVVVREEEGQPPFINKKIWWQGNQPLIFFENILG